MVKINNKNIFNKIKFWLFILKLEILFFFVRMLIVKTMAFLNMFKNNFIANYSRISRDVSPQLDSIRGLSALIVLFAHCYQVLIAPTNDSLYGIVGICSQAAVMVFFVLSGLLIGKSLTRNINQNSSLQLKPYFIDRLNRIYPPFVFSLLIIGILYIIAPYFFPSRSLSFISSNQYLAREGFEITLSSVLSSVFFLNGFIGENISVNGPLWSLAYEVWYYVIAAFLLKSSKPFYLVLFSTITLILLILNKIFILYSIVWFSGLLISILHNNNIYNQMIHKMLYILSILGSIIFSYIFLSTQYQLHTIDNITIKNLSLDFYKVFIGLLSACFIYSVLRGSLKFTSAFKGSSSYSYTLYIIHFPILLFIFGVMQLKIQGNLINSLIVASASCIIIILLSKVSAKKCENIHLIKDK